MELLKAIDAILLPLKLLYFSPKKQGFFSIFYKILILKIFEAVGNTFFHKDAWTKK